LTSPKTPSQGHYRKIGHVSAVKVAGLFPAVIVPEPPPALQGVLVIFLKQTTDNRCLFRYYGNKNTAGSVNPAVPWVASGVV
jgi:hypothetical protein